MKKTHAKSREDNFSSRIVAHDDSRDVLYSPFSTVKSLTEIAINGNLNLKKSLSLPGSAYQYNQLGAGNNYVFIY